MKRFVLTLCAVLACMPLVYGQDRSVEETTIITAGMKVPQFAVTMTDGSIVSSLDFEGKVVLINFWATWCPSCRLEMTRVQKDIVERYAGKDFIFLPISRGEDADKVEAFLKKMNYTFPSGIDDMKTVYSMFASNYIPRNFIVDKQGVVVLSSTGYDEEEFGEMLTVLDGLLLE